jgi:hypothetical protein
MLLPMLLAAPALAQMPEPAAAPPAPVAAAPKPPAVKAATPVKTVTPNAERIVTVAAIDKRTGVTRSYVGKPGQSFRFGALTVQVRACEATPPWEQPLEGAFLLIDETIGQLPPKRVYSGWMFAQSPSLHPLEHARYDVWVKSCTMRFPETGPDTVVASKGAADPARSKAKKSAETPTAPSN